MVTGSNYLRNWTQEDFIDLKSHALKFKAIVSKSELRISSNCCLNDYGIESNTWLGEKSIDNYILYSN